MIQYFNTTMKTGKSSASKGSGLGAVIWIGLFAIGGILVYRYIKKRNQVVINQPQED